MEYFCRVSEKKIMTDVFNCFKQSVNLSKNLFLIVSKLTKNTIALFLKSLKIRNIY